MTSGIEAFSLGLAVSRAYGLVRNKGDTYPRTAASMRRTRRRGVFSFAEERRREARVAD
jgi:hypothetical protein